MKNIDDMRILNLIIKQKYFDEILTGTKTQEFREVKPTTINKLLVQDEDGYEVEDEEGNSIPIEYDAIRFYVGYRKDRDSALVEVKSAYTEVFTRTLTDENGEPIIYKVDENGAPLYYKTDEYDEWVYDEDGELIPVDKIYEGSPMPVTEDGEVGMIIDEPIFYEYGGKMWFAQQVVYNLGNVIEADVHEK